MHRIFLEIQYDGSPYCGWQIQSNGKSVQEVLSTAIELLTKCKINLVGCGRTDKGVHACQFYAHFDIAQPESEDLVFRLNQILPKEIAIIGKTVQDLQSHARYDAIERTYCYYIHSHKNPFKNNYSYFFPQMERIDMEKVVSAAQLITQFEIFFPFCKTRSDVTDYCCQIHESKWRRSGEGEWMYIISANRFLRGMVRLIVGMCLLVGQNKLELNTVRKCLVDQIRLPKDWSVPAKGLFLTDVKYSFI